MLFVECDRLTYFNDHFILFKHPLRFADTSIWKFNMNQKQLLQLIIDLHTADSKESEVHKFSLQGRYQSVLIMNSEF